MYELEIRTWDLQNRRDKGEQCPVCLSLHSGGGHAQAQCAVSLATNLILLRTSLHPQANPHLITVNAAPNRPGFRAEFSILRRHLFGVHRSASHNSQFPAESPHPDTLF